MRKTRQALLLFIIVSPYLKIESIPKSILEK